MHLFDVVIFPSGLWKAYQDKIKYLVGEIRDHQESQNIWIAQGVLQSNNATYLKHKEENKQHRITSNQS